MVYIFTDMTEDIMNLFMEDFSVYGSSFSSYLENLSRVRQTLRGHESRPQLGEVSLYGNIWDFPWSSNIEGMN